MSTLFISDLHLDSARPETTRVFFDFLAGDARAADRLYILGDFFEYWIGDDHQTELSTSVAAQLRALSAAGCDTYYMAGNRDFLIGNDYASQCRMRILKDPAVVLVGDRKVILSHGDALCTLDVTYQEFRTEVRDPAWQRDFLQKPLQERLDFAETARAESRNRTRDVDADIMDVTPAAVDQLMERLDASLLIHGHTHRPAIHELSGGRQRIVLGDWYDQGSALWHRNGRFELLGFS